MLTVRRGVLLGMVVVLATAGLAVPASGYVPEKTPRRNVDATARRTVAHDAARGTVAALLIVRGGVPLFSLNADLPLLPASLMKLATTTAAIERFGPAHRFHTRVLAERHRSGVGRLYLVGGGDPTLATHAYVRERFLPKADDPVPVPVFPRGSPTIGRLAEQVSRAGLRNVWGSLIVDDSRFDHARTAPGWLDRYLTTSPDVSLLSALTVNEGFADPDRRTVAADPARAAGAALRQALARRGVRVHGRIVAGRAPRGAVEIARVSSPPLRDIVGYINRYSANYATELVLKALGAEFGKAGTSAEGVRIVYETLAGLRIPLKGMSMADGSGLSLLDRLTATTVAAIVGHILARRGPAGDALRDSLPVAGGPGTLFRRMRGSPTRGNLRGKTGSLRGVRAMAGWVTASDGVPLVYVSIFNGVDRALLLTEPLDRFGRSLARFPRDRP